jgi:hypothetical protein
LSGPEILEVITFLPQDSVYPVVRFSGFALAIELVLGLVYPVVPLFEPLGFVCLVAPAFEPLRLVSPLVGHAFELKLERFVVPAFLGFACLILPLLVLVLTSSEFYALAFEPFLLVILSVWFTSLVFEPPVLVCSSGLLASLLSGFGPLVPGWVCLVIVVVGFGYVVIRLVVVRVRVVLVLVVAVSVVTFVLVFVCVDP